MKKLSLKNLNIEANNMLQRSELKSVYGGYGGSGEPNTCTADCPGGKAVTCTGPQCGATDNVGCYDFKDGVMYVKTCPK